MAPEKSNGGNINQLKNSSHGLTSTSGSQCPFNNATRNPTATTIPPPIPPRHSVQSYSGYNEYRPGNYGGYSYMNNYYRGYNGYNSFGGYMGYPNSSIYRPIGGPSGDVESRFMQYAEESTRSTFHTLETVLQTFSSITMLLESTYLALTNFFKAILSVAENMAKLRSTMGHLLNTFALIRLLKWVYKRIAYMIGFQSENPINEELWQKSLVQTTKEQGSYSWPSLLFLCIFFLAPYLIHKISSSIQQLRIQSTDPKDWSNYAEPVYVATANYDFIAASSEELSLKAGQKIWLAPQPLQPNTPGWWLATDSVNVGLIPSNYVTIVSQLRKRTEQNREELHSNIHNTSTQATTESKQISTVSNVCINPQKNQSTEPIRNNVETENYKEQSS